MSVAVATPPLAFADIETGGVDSQTIYTTRDYGRFSFVDGQRPVDMRRVASLAAAIQENNLLADFPIVVDDEYRIMDGQHRFRAAEQVGVPVHYKFTEQMTPTDVAQAAGLTKDWSLNDHLNAHTRLGNAHYLRMRGFMERHELSSVSLAIKLLTRGTDYSTARDTFKAGSFAYSDEHEAFAELVMARVDDFAPYFDNTTHTSFVHALYTLSLQEEYDHKWMMHKVKQQPRKLQTCRSVGQYIDLLTEIYNYSRQRGNWTYFSKRVVRANSTAD